MNLARRILTDKRVPITLVGGGLAVALALYVLVIFPLTGRVEEARQRRATARESLAVAEASHETASDMARGQTGATEELSRFYRDVLPQDLAGARRITYPRLAALARSHGLVLERRSSVAQHEDGSTLSRLRTTMLLAGDWSNMRRFIDSLENAPEFLVIEEIALNQSEGLADSLVLTLGLATYYQSGAGS